LKSAQEAKTWPPAPYLRWVFDLCQQKKLKRNILELTNKRNSDSAHFVLRKVLEFANKRNSY
jgi:hypothetical protein